MNDDLKTPRLNNRETYVITNNRFNNDMVLIFIDLKKAQIYKIRYRNSSHQETEKLMSFDCLHLFRPNEHSEDYHIRKTNDENFLFKFEQKNIFMWEKNYLVLKQRMKR